MRQQRRVRRDGFDGLLRARYRDLGTGPPLLEPGRVYVLEIDMWSTANRFNAGPRLRLDVSSADFPRFDRNANLGGTAGSPIPARPACKHAPPLLVSRWARPHPL